jgi:hypothetical protein
MNRVQERRTADKLAILPTLTFNQHGQCLTHLFSVENILLRAQQLLQ